MTLLNRKADYALLILWFLHQRPEGGCAREIADRFGLSRAFVANILKELCQQGFVASHRGVKGGYALLRPVAEVSLAELIEALDEPVRVAACNHDGPGGGSSDGCSLVGFCPMQGPIDLVHRKVRDLLRTVTLADLFRSAPPVPERSTLLASLPLCP
jgi:Rrf2 family protein